MPGLRLAEGGTELGMPSCRLRFQLRPAMGGRRSQGGRLRRSLAVYRVVSGQPRQEDLLTYLVDRVSPERYRSNEASVSAICIFRLRVNS